MYKRTEESEKRITEAYKRLGTYKRVAEELGCSWNTAQRVCVKLGANKGQGNHEPGNNGGGSPVKVTDAQILEDIKTMTRQEIADKYHMHVESIARRMRRLGVRAVYAYGGNKHCDGRREKNDTV